MVEIKKNLQNLLYSLIYALECFRFKIYNTTMLEICNGLNKSWKIVTVLGANSQNFLRQIHKIFVTLGLKISRFLILNVDFEANITKG